MIRLFSANAYFFLPYLVFIIAGGILQLVFSPTEIFMYINTHYHLLTDFLFQYLTHLGDGVFYACIVVMLAFVSYRAALTGLTCFLASSLLAQLLKRLMFAEALRPKAFFEGSEYVLHLVEGVNVHAFHSFPSGHSTTAFSVFCLLSLVFRQRYWGLIWFGMAVLAAYSRIYLAQHFFWDVYAGSFIGVLTTVTVYYFLDVQFTRGRMRWVSGSLLNRKHPGEMARR